MAASGPPPASLLFHMPGGTLSSVPAPVSPALVAAAERRRELFRMLAEKRKAQALSQTAAAAAMYTSQSALARLESSAADTKLSTLERYAAALGCRVEYKLVPVSKPRAVVR
ncbi:MAG TPA: helix-turn-helix domain-containing protein [Baekduia sp.]|nr:helix-turn-helix domain-containing protein [Baekduia sp.]